MKRRWRTGSHSEGEHTVVASGKSYVKSPVLIHLMFNCSTPIHPPMLKNPQSIETLGLTGAEIGHVFGQGSTCGSLNTPQH